MKIGVLCSRIRGEEKLLVAAIKRLGHTAVIMKTSSFSHFFGDASSFLDVDIVLNRSISSTRALYISYFLERLGVLVVNPYEVVYTCENKLYTSLALEKNNVPTPKIRVAYTIESAMEALEDIGYPAVIKPTTGSWGRMISRIDNPTAAEAVLEHKAVLGTYHHSVFYIQEYIEKPGRDIRVFVLDGQAICAIYRHSKHWITNTARGGTASNCPITKPISEICRQASEAIGGGILAMDLFEMGSLDNLSVNEVNHAMEFERGFGGGENYSINEINHAMEFRNSEIPTGVSISEHMVRYLVDKASS